MGQTIKIAQLAFKKNGKTFWAKILVKKAYLSQLFMYHPIQPIRTIHTTVSSNSYAPMIRINDTKLFSNDTIRITYRTILTTMTVNLLT